jgi:hypothetical protein
MDIYEKAAYAERITARAELFTKVCAQNPSIERWVIFAKIHDKFEPEKIADHIDIAIIGL